MKATQCDWQTENMIECEIRLLHLSSRSVLHWVQRAWRYKKQNQKGYFKEFFIIHSLIKDWEGELQGEKRARTTTTNTWTSHRRGGEGVIGEWVRRSLWRSKQSMLDECVFMGGNENLVRKPAREANWNDAALCQWKLRFCSTPPSFLTSIFTLWLSSSLFLPRARALKSVSDMVCLAQYSITPCRCSIQFCRIVRGSQPDSMAYKVHRVKQLNQNTNI